MGDLRLRDLVDNETMSRAIAETLTTTVREGHSFVVFAIPRLAGKSTTLHAMLEHREASMPVRTVTGTTAEQYELRRSRAGGYLIVPEIANSGVPEYLWGAPVRRVFKTLASGYSLAVALHAPGVKEAFHKISKDNRVPDNDASRIRLAVYIRSIGEWQAPERRRVSEVHEIGRVVGGMPEARLLHRWDEPTDRFVDVQEPRVIGRGAAGR